MSSNHEFLKTSGDRSRLEVSRQLKRRFFLFVVFALSMAQISFPSTRQLDPAMGNENRSGNNMQLSNLRAAPLETKILEQHETKNNSIMVLNTDKTKDKKRDKENVTAIVDVILPSNCSKGVDKCSEKGQIERHHDHNGKNNEAFTKDHDGTVATIPLQPKEESQEGIAGCLLVLSDTLRLTEWIAYHYTTLPLSRLIIALDPTNPSKSLSRIEALVHDWMQATGLDISIWRNDTWVPEGRMRNKTLTSREHKYQRERQDHFAYNCMKDHYKHGQSWTVLTDTDEFLNYNWIHKDEDYSFYDDILTIWKKKEVIDKERNRTLALRKQLPSIGQVTFYEYLSTNADDISKAWPQHPHCIRVPGLFFGKEEATTSELQQGLTKSTLEALGNQGSATDFAPLNQLMTLKYQKHQKKRTGDFSKVILDVSKMKPKDFRRGNVRTIHNPSVTLCGRNGPHASGTDYISSILRIHHYLGSFESYMERAGDVRGRTRSMYDRKHDQKQNAGGWAKTDDADVSPWVNAFVQKVGPVQARRLLKFLDLKLER